MTRGEILDRAETFLSMTEGQMPTGPDAPDSFRSFSQTWDMGYVKTIQEWSAPDDDKELTGLVSGIKEFALTLEKYPARMEQLTTRVRELIDYLRRNP